MGRAPCCDKMGLKKGPWTPEEDLILINHINTFGHKNWRALPKQAGLLRCGKSCRLRWTNYLRPDIKRGNFTREEEDTIIKLHQMLGNRWSAIAARLAGRTDNEIKNVWHSRLKKRLRLPVPQQETETERPDRKPNAKQMMQSALDAPKYNYQHPRPTQEQGPVNQNFPTTASTTRHVDHVIIEAESTAEDMPLYSSPRCLSSDMSTFTTSTDSNDHNTSTVNCDVSLNNNSAADSLVDDFWSEVLSADNSNETSGFLAINGVAELMFPLLTEEGVPGSSSLWDSMDFWYDYLRNCKNYDVGATHTHV